MRRLLNDEPCLVAFVHGTVKSNGLSRISLAEKCFWYAVRIFFYDPICRGENSARRAVILFKSDNFRIGKFAFKRQQIFNIRLSP